MPHFFEYGGWPSQKIASGRSLLKWLWREAKKPFKKHFDNFIFGAQSHPNPEIQPQHNKRRQQVNYHVSLNANSVRTQSSSSKYSYEKEPLPPFQTSYERKPPAPQAASRQDVHVEVTNEGTHKGKVFSSEEDLAKFLAVNSRVGRTSDSIYATEYGRQSGL